MRNARRFYRGEWRQQFFWQYCYSPRRIGRRGQQRREAEAAETAGIPQEARCLAGAAALEPGETPALPEGHGMAETGATRLKVCRFTTGAECLAGTAGRGMGL